MAAPITAVDRKPGSVIRDPGVGRSTRSFACDERTDLFDATRVEHLPGLDPAATRGADAEPHLAREPFGPVAVAVDDDCDTGRRGTACDAAVHVQMAGRTVDFHRRSGLGCCLKQRLKVQIEAG